MLLYCLGKMVSIKSRHLVFECGDLGYIFNIANENGFTLNDKVQKIYAYEQQNEYGIKRYAFSSFWERLLFEDLIGLPGIGPKTALAILRHGYQKICNLIINSDVSGLAELPYIGNRIARQIVIELEQKYVAMFKNGEHKLENSEKLLINTKPNAGNYNELKNTLKVLGFSQEQIQIALDSLKDFTLPHEKLVEESIRFISNVSA